MKYGETLRQRSIEEWATHNVDYDEIKKLIKQRTSPGPGKAVSIPGKDDKTAIDFENEMLHILKAEHERVNLFVRSKSGEIKRRLDHLTKQLRQLHARTSRGQHAIAGKVIERYSKIEEDCLKAGEEVRSLSRFIGAQRLAFQKLLKKYKKWTASSELGARFQKDIARKPDSFSKIDLKPLLDDWTEVLHAVRTQFQDSITGLRQRSGSDSSEKPQSVPGLKASPNVDNVEVADAESNLDFDVRVSVLPRATYWVHQENVVELQVLLMKHTRHRSRREMSAAETGLIILDDPERFAKRHSNIAAKGADEGVPRPAGTLRWADRSDVVALVEKSREDDREGSISACFKPKRLSDVLCAHRGAASNASTTSTESSSAAQGAPEEDEVRSWLLQHPKVKPLVCISSNRTRFVGLNPGDLQGLWVALDNDIRMKKASFHTIAGKDFISRCRDEALPFPHAVLQLGTQGNAVNELIRVMDNSHLRVRGFSLEVHAVAVCCNIEKLPTPFWISALDRDIRQVPEPSRVRCARRTGFRDLPTSEDGRVGPSQGYWNEYEDPEQARDDYVLYVDPQESSGLPGARFWRRIWRFLSPRSKMARSLDEVPASFADEQTSLLNRSEAPTGDNSVDDDDATSSMDEPPPEVRLAARYSTLNAGQRRQQRFSANESANDMMSILSETRRRQDSGKLRLYAICFTASLALVGMVTLVELTGRKKQRDAVDVGATIGVVLSMIFALVALLTFLSRKCSAGWLHMVVVLAVFVVICAANAALLAWVIN